MERAYPLGAWFLGGFQRREFFRNDHRRPLGRLDLLTDPEAQVTTLLHDRNGDPFTGTPAELKRHNNKLCKRASRAKADPVLDLPLPPGIAAALNRICEAGGFEDDREALSQLILGADRLLSGDRHAFDALVEVTVTIGSLDKWLPLIGQDDLTEQPQE